MPNLDSLGNRNPKHNATTPPAFQFTLNSLHCRPILSYGQSV